MNEAQTVESGFEKTRRELASAGRNLWLAGLGAVAEVEESGRGLFDRLVERGRPMETKQRQTFEKLGDKTGTTVRELGKLVQDTMEYETRGVLKRFGLLTRDDVKILAARLDTLAKKINELAARQEIAPELSVSEPVLVTPEGTPAASTKKRQPRQRKH